MKLLFSSLYFVFRILVFCAIIIYKLVHFGGIYGKDNKDIQGRIADFNAAR